MRKLFVVLLILICVGWMMSCSPQGENNVKEDVANTIDSVRPNGLPTTARLADSGDNLSVYLNDDKKAEYDEDAYTTSLYIYDHKTKDLTKLLTTTEPEGYSWIKETGKDAVRCSLADIHAIYEARLFPYDRKLLVCGCFDMRNVFSFIIDIETKDVLCLPTNGGLLGFTSEEGFAVMQSYEYNTGVDEEGEFLCGRHTLISVFDENGRFVRSMSLEQE